MKREEHLLTLPNDLFPGKVKVKISPIDCNEYICGMYILDKRIRFPSMYLPKEIPCSFAKRK